MERKENPCMTFIPCWILDEKPVGQHTRQDAILSLWRDAQSTNGLVPYTIRQLASQWLWSKSSVGRLLKELLGQGKLLKTPQGYAFPELWDKHIGTPSRGLGQGLGHIRRRESVSYVKSWDKTRDSAYKKILVTDSLISSYLYFKGYSPLKKSRYIDYSILFKNNILYNNSRIIIENKKCTLKKQEKSMKVIHNESSVHKPDEQATKKRPVRGKNKEYPAWFEELYGEDMRKTDKVSALREYKRAIEREKSEQGITDEEARTFLLNKRRTYLNYCRYKKTEEQYIKKLYTWLRDSCYNNHVEDVPQVLTQEQKLSKLSAEDLELYQRCPFYFKEDYKTGFIRKQTNAEMAGLA